jgi:hypothetical protein
MLPPIYSPMVFQGFEQDPVFQLWLTTTFITPTSGSLTRDANGYIQTITNSLGTTTITRDADNLISSATNGTWTLTITRDANKYISSWSVV